MSIIVNIHEAKTQLSRLVEQAAKGREFVIAKAGKPMVRVIPIEPVPVLRALGFLVGQGVVELDVKTGFAAEIDNMFSGAEG
jgi:prevent-host-death family protein